MIFKSEFSIGGRDIKCQKDLDSICLYPTHNVTKHLLKEEKIALGKEEKIALGKENEKALKSAQNKAINSQETK